MPNRWPISSGNWNEPAIWNGGLGVPTASDDIFANNQAVYIDTNITVLSLRNAASASAILASGSFYLNDGVTVNLSAANAFLATVAPLIIISGSNSARINGNNTGTGTTVAPIIQVTGSATLTMSGSFVGGSGGGNIQHASSGSLILTGSYTPTGAALSAHLITMTGNGSLYVTGSLSGNQGTSYGIFKTAGSGSIYVIGSVLSSGNGPCIIKQSFGDIDIIGNVFANYNIITNSAGGSIRVTGDVRGGGSFFQGIRNSAANVLMVITGSVIGSSTAGGSQGYGIANSGPNSTIIISGSVLGGTGGSIGINNTGANSIIIVTGSIIGSSAAGAIQNTTTGIVSISGSVSAGIGGSAISNAGAGTLTIQGPISASLVFPGIQSTSTGNVFLTGPFLNTNNRNAVFAQNLQLLPGSTPTWTFDTETYGGTKTLSAITAVGGYPDVSNVRSGSVYGDTNQFTGTVIIPSASNVLFGVPVDAVTGSALFNTQTIWGALTSSLTTPGSIGARLRNTATVATDAALITTRRKL
jgi:hypothetical protein